MTVGPTFFATAAAAPAGHRYWRATALAISSHDWQPTELQFWETSSVRADNASTILTHNSTSYFGVIGNLVDGNVMIQFELFPMIPSNSVFWDFGLGVTKAVTGFKHADRGGAGPAGAFTAITAQYSDDFATWTTFGSATSVVFSGDTLSAFIPFI